MHEDLFQHSGGGVMPGCFWPAVTFKGKTNESSNVETTWMKTCPREVLTSDWGDGYSKRWRDIRGGFQDNSVKVLDGPVQSPDLWRELTKAVHSFPSSAFSFCQVKILCIILSSFVCLLLQNVYIVCMPLDRNYKAKQIG